MIVAKGRCCDILPHSETGAEPDKREYGSPTSNEQSLEGQGFESREAGVAVGALEF